MIRLGLVNDVELGWGSRQARGLGAELAASLSLPITGVLLLITAFVMYCAHRLGKLGAEQYSRYAAALILAFMLGSKVLSPQYLIWLLPLVPLSFGGRAGVGVSAVFLAAFWTTRQELVQSYDLVALRSPAPELLFTRNLLLVLLGFCCSHSRQHLLESKNNDSRTIHASAWKGSSANFVQIST